MKTLFQLKQASDWPATVLAVPIRVSPDTLMPHTLTYRISRPKPKIILRIDERSPGTMPELQVCYPRGELPSDKLMVGAALRHTLEGMACISQRPIVGALFF